MFNLSSKQYDILKFIAWLWGPLFIFLTSIVNHFFLQIPHAESILFVLGAIDVLIGAYVSKSNIDYNKTKEE